MGAGQSIPDGKPPAHGLHVLRVTSSSPASQTNLEPFFDFIIGYERDSVSRWNANIEAHDFERVVEEYEGRRLFLIVWSSKTKAVRQVPIVPSRAWSQPHSLEADPRNSESQPTPQPSLLGLSMRVCEPELSLDNVWHVLDVLEGSPAESAGLVPYGDWIVGWSGGVLGDEGDFYDVVEAHEDKPLRVYVYSFDFDTLREVVLVPNRQWGGEGLLGCVFGFGLLHRIPAIPEGEERGEDNFLSEGNTFVPADTAEEAYETYPHDHGVNSQPSYDVRERDVHDHDEPGRDRDTTDRNDYQRNGIMSVHSHDSPHYLDPPNVQTARMVSPLQHYHHPQPLSSTRPTSPPYAPFSAARPGSPGAAFLHARRLSGMLSPSAMGRPWSPGPIGSEMTFNRTNPISVPSEGRESALGPIRVLDVLTGHEGDGADVTDTETTEAGSEATSQDSLTSID